MPTFFPDRPMDLYLLIQGIAFLATLLYGSFFEWTLHRYIMHRRTWFSYPFELHAKGHHKLFRDDETFHAQNEEMKKHVTFTPRDYILLLLVNTPLLLSVEVLFQLPVLIGGWAAILVYLGTFDFLHWTFHMPKQRFFEKWKSYAWLKQHHWLHHRHQDRNLNVVLPIADFVFRTRISKSRESA